MAIITGVFSLGAVVITGFFAHQHGERDAIAEINAEVSNITGNNNQITINDISTFIASYQDL